MARQLSQLAGQIVFLFLVFVVALFVPAGTIAWVAGWVYLVLFFSFVVAISLWLLRYNPALLTERMAGHQQSKQEGWDRALIALVSVVFLVWLLIMPLDAVRFGWSRMPVGLQTAGALVQLGSFYVFFVTFRENSYLSPVVRVQSERGQTVVSTGPYAVVRHPMYAGFLLFMVGTSLLLGSWYGLLVGSILVLLVARRAVLEERTLREKLAGYEEYMQKVRYRFVPVVW